MSRYFSVSLISYNKVVFKIELLAAIDCGRTVYA